MRLKKKVIAGFLLGALGIGLFQPLISAEVCPMAEKVKACCSADMRDSDCCPVQETSNCPAFEKKTPAPLAVLPSRTTLSCILVAGPAAIAIVQPKTVSQYGRPARNLPPPDRLCSSLASPRAPPALA